MNPPKKLISKQQAQEQQQSVTQETTQAESGLKFATVEEMLRHDALHTPVPPSIERRLEESIKKEPSPAPWWRRLFKPKSSEGT
jgi:hypothetical protein